MPDPKELQKKLKNLNSAQFGQVLFELNIDQAIIREHDAPAEKAIEVIRLLEQQPDGLTHLENILKDASSSTASNSNSSRSPEPSPKAPRRSLPLLGVGLGLPLLIVIVFAIWPKAPLPSHQPPTITPILVAKDTNLRVQGQDLVENIAVGVSQLPPMPERNDISVLVSPIHHSATNHNQSF